MNARPLVLLTDFGSTDFYAGVMRAVLASSAPSSPVIDLHHDIPAHDVNAASFVLGLAFDYLPPDAVVVCVVDPGVGTERGSVIVTTGGRTLVGPDNGFATDLLAAGRECAYHRIAEELARRATGAVVTGATFHGRDIFAPVAAAIANGASVERFGQRTEDIVILPGVPTASFDADVIRARARYIDHFGNVITDISKELVQQLSALPANVRVRVQGRDAGALGVTYGPGRRDELIAIINSWGMVEVAINGGRAIDYLGNQPPATIEVELRRGR
jgi:S-adenosylmethionine hydrolase